MRRSLRFGLGRLGSADGFTLVEALVAAVVLAVGLLGSLGYLDTAVLTSRSTAAHEGATNLARQITEDAREIPFSQLSNSTIASQLQAFPGLANSGSGSTWQISRRGVTYTITASECADDTTNGSGGNSSSVTWCPDSAYKTLPNNFARVTVNVAWTAGSSNSQSVQEVATIGSTGQAVGLTTSSLAVATPTPIPTTGVSGSNTQPQVTSSSVTQMTFSVTAPSGTTAIIWTVNGVNQSSWSSTQSGTTWTSSAWTLTGLSDGTYQIGAAAENGSGVVGPAVTIPVQLIRSIPAAPTVTDYGYNANLYESGSGPETVAELGWQQDSQLNVTGYHVYNPSGTLICSTTPSTIDTSCGTNAWCTSETACIDLNPPAPTSSNLSYAVKPVYNNSQGQSTEGPATNVTMYGTPYYTYTLAASSTNTGTNCSANGATLESMFGTYTPGSTASTQALGTNILFCSDAFSAGQVVEGGGTAAVYLTNPNSATCKIQGSLGVDGVQALTATDTIPASTTTATKFTFTFTLNSLLTMNSGDRLTLEFSEPSSSGCSSSKPPVLYYGSTGDPSQLQTTPEPVQAPGTPTSFSVTANSDGSATLNWTAPSGSTPVNFYRIYRGGKNYTNRYDIVDPTVSCTSGSCSWTDPSTKRSSPPYTYYVTAVGGTTAGSNMAESAATGSASG